MNDWRKFLTLGVSLVLAAAILAEAQRPGLFSALQTTSTAAGSLLVGCATGTTTACSGPILAGTIALTSTEPLVRFTESDASATNKVWDFQSQGGSMLLNTNNDTGTLGVNVFTITRSGNLATNFALVPPLALASEFSTNGVQTVTTTSGSQSITLSAGKTVLNVTTGGSSADDIIDHITGQSTNRHLFVCWVAETAPGDGPVTLDASVSGTAADRIEGVASKPLGLGACAQLMYDTVASRWRQIGQS